MWAKASRTWGLSWLLLALLTSCSLLIDSDKKQCTPPPPEKRATDTQCAAPYVCGSAGICTKTGCKTAADCRQPGLCIDGMCEPPACDLSSECEPDQLCNTESGGCVKAVTASCQQHKDCAPYEGAQVCINADGRCGAFECQTQAQCIKQSPTATCEAGACVDKTWGCLGVRDPRPAQNMSQTGTLKLKVLFIPMNTGESETRVKNLDVRVCPASIPACTNSVTLPGDWVYDDQNFLVISKLRVGQNYRVELRGTSSAPGEETVPLLNGEYLMYRTLEGVTQDPKPVLMLTAGLREMIAMGLNVQLDPKLAFLFMRIFDCTDIEVEGVAVSVSRTTSTGCGGECETTIFYQNTSNQPVMDATETNAAGRAGIANMVPEMQTRITLTRVKTGKAITSFVVSPHANWITYVHFWPWDYGTGT